MKPQTTGLLAWVSCVLGCIPLVGLLVGIKVCSHYPSMAPLPIEHTRMGVAYLVVFGGPLTILAALVVGILVGRFGKIKTQLPPVIVGFLASLVALMWYVLIK